MTTYMENHTYCSCGEKVYPGQKHVCEDLGTFMVPTLDTLYCKWCKTYCQPIKRNDNKVHCSSCDQILHGVVCNPKKLTMHYDTEAKSYEKPQQSSNFKPVYHMSGYVPEQSPRKSWLGGTSQGTYYSSPYYASSTTYLQRYDNPVRASPLYDPGNAWHNQSAYVYDITHS
ncbi:hypothetical protein QJ857_gp0384 [Tupanvirus soda lake]|uniref:Uncharacterized protein n=2 Tax=Tupanvirus TaxID=2094720 RepID=A0A6N1NP09_9VIRU|nr:hypothetical protein QJ857_gp0384 [Tupanvirus soda lake]QKU35650.1 hypothetical protein [Tupanvirus soda lake]